MPIEISKDCFCLHRIVASIHSFRRAIKSRHLQSPEIISGLSLDLKKEEISQSYFVLNSVNDTIRRKWVQKTVQSAVGTFVNKEKWSHETGRFTETPDGNGTVARRIM